MRTSTHGNCGPRDVTSKSASNRIITFKNVKTSVKRWSSTDLPIELEARLLRFIPTVEPSGPCRLTRNRSKCASVGRPAEADLLSEPQIHSQSYADEVVNVYDTLGLFSSSQDEDFRVSQDRYAGRREWKVRDVPISKEEVIHELSITRYARSSCSSGTISTTAEQVEHTLVMVHGYGAGLGFFVKNFEPLSRRAGWRVYALDLRGMGLSTRSDFKTYIKAHRSRERKVEATENWFVEAIEKWRQACGIETFTLLGHSMGGYLSSVYTLKYPTRVNKLILVSPVGFELRDPSLPSFSSSVVESRTDVAVDRVCGGASETDVGVSPLSDQSPSPTEQTEPKVFVVKDQAARKFNPVKELLWRGNQSVFRVIRFAGPLGYLIHVRSTLRRSKFLGEPELETALDFYAYGLIKLAGSGEFALTRLLRSNSVARRSLVEPITTLGQQQRLERDRVALRSAPPSRERNGKDGFHTAVPVVFIYGQGDWVRWNGARQAVEVINHRAGVKDGSGEQLYLFDESDGSFSSSARAFPAKLVIVPKGRHNSHIEVPSAFNTLVLAELEDVEGRQGV